MLFLKKNKLKVVPGLRKIKALNIATALALNFENGNSILFTKQNIITFKFEGREFNSY